MDKTVTCPQNDPKCIADHQGGDEYCFRRTAGSVQTPVPEPTEGVGAAVIESPTLTILETPKSVVEVNDTITLPSQHGFKVGDDLTVSTYETGVAVSQNVTVTEVVSETVLKYVALTPERYLKRWNDSWLEGIDYKKSTKPVSGRRLFRNNRAGSGKVRRLPRVRGCGHALDMAKQPRHRNCKSCWTAFFRNQDEMAENIAKIIVEQGAYRVAETFGFKFLTRFHEYCKLVERVEALRKAYEEEQASVRESTIGVAEGAVQPFGDDAEVSIEVG